MATLNLNASANNLPENETSFQFQEEHDISLDDPTQIFKKKGLHFLHLNCNSLLRKDRNRNGGGVACFIHKSIAYDVRTDFFDDF